MPYGLPRPFEPVLGIGKAENARLSETQAMVKGSPPMAVL